MTKFSPLMMSRSLRLLKHLYRDFVYTTKRKRNIEKIKLVAVARNEAAYLPEWIFHHLYFGFCEIDIYFNQCSDNTEALIPLLKGLPVNFYNADEAFERPSNSPQIEIYKKSLASSGKDCDAVMFLDIDEFWVPVDLDDSIINVCNSLPKFDTLSFQWKNKVEKQTEFSRALESTICVELKEQVKTLVRSHLKIAKMNPHNCLDDGLLQRFADGSLFESKGSERSRTCIRESNERAFILHRMNRSEREYIAMLIRGRPIGDKATSVFKNNRTGFLPPDKTQRVAQNKVKYQKYDYYMRKRLESVSMQQFLSVAREHVLLRYTACLKAISHANSKDKVLLKRLLKGVTLSEVQQILSED